MMPGMGWVAEPRYTSNGAQIYFTGVNENGQSIRYTGGPSYGGMMMQQRLSCASCHGQDGSGGVHTMHMQVMDAPDIRLSALSGETDEHGGDGHTDDHGGEYSVETFREAVVEGRHPDGSSLDRDMPRWQLREDDLVDLYDFIKSLP